MTAGRPRVPDAIKIARGTLRKDRQNKNKPKVQGIPKRPFPARSIEGKKWDEVVDGLQRLGLIDEIDGTNLEGLCICYGLAVNSQKMLDEEGYVTGANLNPWYKINAEAWARIRMYSNDLGLSHLGRQRLEAKNPTMQEEMESKYLG
jgi:P27 family predicted phage terminase small subunit